MGYKELNTKVVFLDRDGVINVYPGDFQYVKSWKEFRFLPGVITALKRLNDAGFKILVISNQAGVGKGIYSQDTLDLITENMLNGLSEKGVKISGVYYCTHRKEEECPCRKPKAGLVDIAVARLKEEGINLDLKKSYLVGDTVRDIETGKTKHLKTILIFSGKEKAGNKNSWHLKPDFTAPDLLGAVDIILKG